MKGQDAEGLKMVPKRQIHLKKKKKDGEDGAEQVNTDKLQVCLLPV